MSDYQPVKKALEAGTDPVMICMTCPWDRNCVTPPSMTAQDIDQEIEKAALKDQAPADPAQQAQGRLPMATLMTALIYGGKDTALQACPVLALRLRSGDGRKIAGTVRELMQGWAD